MRIINPNIQIPITRWIDNKSRQNIIAKDKFLIVNKPKIKVLKEYAIKPLVCSVNIKVG